MNEKEEKAKTAAKALQILEKGIKIVIEPKGVGETEKLNIKTSKEFAMLESILNSDVIRKCIEIELRSHLTYQTSLFS